MQKSLLVGFVTVPLTSLFNGDRIPMFTQKKKLLLGVALLLTVGGHALPAMAQSTESCAPMTLDSGASACGTPSTNTSTDPLSLDDHRAIESDRLRAIDPPIESDPLGNALIGASPAAILDGAAVGAVHGLVEYGAEELYDSWKHPSGNPPQTFSNPEDAQGAEGSSGAGY